MNKLIEQVDKQNVEINFDFFKLFERIKKTDDKNLMKKYDQ